MDNTNNYTTFPWIKKASTCPTWSACVLESSCRLVVGDVCGASSKTLATCCNYILWLSVMKVWSQRPKENNQNRHACCIKFHLSVCKAFLGKNTESYRHNFTSSDRSFVFDFIWSCFFGLETWVLFGDPFMWLFFFTVTLLFLMFVCTSLVFSCVPGIVFVPKCWLWSLCLEQKTSLYNITISIYIHYLHSISIQT